MTTPRPTADLVTSPPDLTGAPDLPDWLPDEATLNRLAGEFFAALPGSSPAGVSALGRLGRLGRVGRRPHAATVRGSATADRGADQGAGQGCRITRRGWTCPRDRTRSRGFPATAVPPHRRRFPVTGGPIVAGRRPCRAGGVPDLPGVAATEPAAGSGYSPGRSIPDLTEFTSGLLGGEGSRPVLPEGPIVPGLTGLQLADPGRTHPRDPRQHGATTRRADPRSARFRSAGRRRRITRTVRRT